MFGSYGRVFLCDDIRQVFLCAEAGWNLSCLPSTPSKLAHPLVLKIRYLACKKNPLSGILAKSFYLN
jgi:hypothetical protein